jgi:hypothetical protein
MLVLATMMARRFEPTGCPVDSWDGVAVTDFVDLLEA